MLDDVLGLVDTIRCLQPTSRTSDSRIWGPFADSKNLGWQWKLDRQPRDGRDDVRLRPRVSRTPGGRPTWVEFVPGPSTWRGGVKQGNGTVTADFAALAAAGFRST